MLNCLTPPPPFHYIDWKYRIQRHHLELSSYVRGIYTSSGISIYKWHVRKGIHMQVRILIPEFDWPQGQSRVKPLRQNKTMQHWQSRGTESYHNTSWYNQIRICFWLRKLFFSFIMMNLMSKAHLSSAPWRVYIVWFESLIPAYFLCFDYANHGVADSLIIFPWSLKLSWSYQLESIVGIASRF